MLKEPKHGTMTLAVAGVIGFSMPGLLCPWNMRWTKTHKGPYPTIEFRYAAPIPRRVVVIG